MRLVEFALVSCFLHHQRLLDVLCLSPCVVLFPLTWLYCLIKLWRINNFKSHLSIHHLQNKYRCLLITFPTYLNSYSPNCIRIFPFYHTHTHTHTHTNTHHAIIRVIAHATCCTQKALNQHRAPPVMSFSFLMCILTLWLVRLYVRGSRLRVSTHTVCAECTYVRFAERGPVCCWDDPAVKRPPHFWCS